jgi:hypothetical protein
VKAFVRADGSLLWLSQRTKIDLGDLERLLKSEFHWVTGAAAKALEAHLRVPVTVEYPDLVLGTVPAFAIQPYLTQIIEEFGAIKAGDALGVDPRRIFTLRGQISVTTETAERVVLAATGGPTALYDDEALRRFWFAGLPSATLRVRQQKLLRQNESRKRRAARELAAA